MTIRGFLSDALVFGLLLGAVHCGRPQEEPQPGPQVTPSTGGLGGTSWRLVKFQTIAFGTDHSLSVRFDCNRGRDTWRSAAAPQLGFGPLALTRAMCPPGSLHDQLVKQWPYVRSYVMRNGHLFLSLMADGGIYEFEPMSPEGSMDGAIRGTSTYRERMALPPGAVLEATLEDVSRADAPAEVIGRARVERPGNPPIAFAIPYDPSRIDSRHRYAVRARIVVEGKPFFLTDQRYPVLTGGSGSQVEVQLRRVSRSSETTVPLENTYWKLTDLGGTPVIPVAGQPEPHLILNSVTRSAGGSGGCNRMTGQYELSGDSLRLERMLATLMACAGGMETEHAFLRALDQVRRWRIGGRQLELLDESGTAVARFEERHME
jgi:putative lipoprotein